MGWAKFDDRRHTNGKLIAAGLAANGLDANGITYCAANETDGFIADGALPVLAPMISQRQRITLADVLVTNKRWKRDDEREGWWVQGYLDYHPSHGDLEKRRQEDRDRKASQKRDAKGQFQAESVGSPNGSQADSTGSPPDPIPSHPDPSHPIPRELLTSPNNCKSVDPENGGEIATQPGEGEKLRELVTRLASVCSAENREAALREAAIVVGLCHPHTPLELIDRAVTIITPKRPVLPRFALQEIEKQRRLAGLPAVRLSIDAIVRTA